MSAARSAFERVSLYSHAAVNVLVLDDWKALTDPHSSTLQRIEGAADLASWAIPEGKVAEIAGRALINRLRNFATKPSSDQGLRRP